MMDTEYGLIKIMASYPQILEEAAEAYSPAQLANFCYELARNSIVITTKHRASEEEGSLRSQRLCCWNK